MPTGIPKNGINKGWFKSEEMKGNINGFQKGKKHLYYGKSRSEEDREKIKKGMKGKKNALGYRQTDKAKRLVSEAQKGKRKPKIQGKNHWNWKNGVTLLAKQIRECFKYRQWRSDIFTKDDFTCILCSKRGGWIEADHYPKRFAIILQESRVKTLEEALKYEEFWNINNGRTLCLDCHNKNKNYGQNYKRNNYPKRKA